MPQLTVQSIPGTGLRVVLTPDGSGWGYEVRDTDGRLVTHGWSRGKRLDAFDEAVSAARRYAYGSGPMNESR